ncbi:hypothetical protein [Sphaerisporangium fuscum]|uniref:hypothetical protein n=1 Tax=Sphaerisporangium fuscum TaxID=2835868 RepID=UPI001BDD24DD|nr:hypothetical protein [Sphaerisporangium fuscum]
MDTHLTNEPARARTDIRGDGATVAGPGPDAHRAIRRAGIGLAAGTLVWAASIFAVGTTGGGMVGRIGDLAGLAFQLGVFCLLGAQLRTRALGVSRAAMVTLKVEMGLLGVASVWSLLHGVMPDAVQNAAWLGILDLFWPLSMLGMFAISVKLAFAARWRGELRWWPLVAESWAVVTVPTFLLLGDEPSRWVGGGHLLIGYAALGVLLARRPELTLPAGRDAR